MFRNRLTRKWMTLGLISVLVLAVLPASAPAWASATSSYIVQGTTTGQAAQQVAALGGTVTTNLDIINAVSAQLDPEAAAKLKSAPGIRSVFADPDVRAADTGDGGERDSAVNSGPTVPETDYPDVSGADLVWQEGISGRGISVAVLDTGISREKGLARTTSGDLGHIVAWADFVGHSPQPVDPNGHGTHVSGIIANTQVGPDGEWNGIAPNVNLVGVRVLDQNGTGTYTTVIEGIQWVLQHRVEYGIRVMNLSLLAEVQSPYWADPLDQAVMQAWADGITVVTAAGNSGPTAMTIGVPGNTPYVITVGAFTDAHSPADWSDDALAIFSSAGPTLDGFVKPDLVAPGAHMVSTMNPGAKIVREHDGNKITNDYFSMAGTSQAAAVVSGTAALILAQHPDLQPDQVKYRLQVTALPWVDPTTHKAGYSLWQQGAGRVNAPDAVFGVANGSANLGLDIQADLKGTGHYRGYSYYNHDTGEFRLYGDDSNSTAGFGAWSGGFGAWSGGFGAWSGGFGAWSGGFGAWSGSTAWDGGFGAWSGGFGAWSGGFGAWSGGFGAWSGGFGAWSGSTTSDGGFGAWSGSFVENYLAGIPADATTSEASVGQWIDEP